MTLLTFTEKEKRALINLIQERIETHLSRFPFAKYPMLPLDEWKQIMCDPSGVTMTQLKEMLSWALGSWQRKDFPTRHGRTMRSIINQWPDFIKKLPPDPSGWLEYWEPHISDWTSGFNAVSFLMHLHRADDYEIVDHHRLQSMNELLKEINHQEGGRALTFSIKDQEAYTGFFRSLLPKLPFENNNRVQLDRFLKAYGNRNSYKNVARSYTTKEPILWSFSWKEASSKSYNLNEITLRSNADILFACLLIILDQYKIKHHNLTVGHVIDLLPVGTAGMCNPATYNYALIALFGNQKGRDYFIFEERTIQNSFTLQANNSTRDMRFPFKESNHLISINPKYIVEQNSKA